MPNMTGPLRGVKALEMPAIGPVPFCGMLLADLGADVLRLDRTQATDLGVPVAPRFDVLGRGKRSLAIDLKVPESRDLVCEPCAKPTWCSKAFGRARWRSWGWVPMRRSPRIRNSFTDA